MATVTRSQPAQSFAAIDGRQGPLRHRRSPAARACAGEDARLGDPQGAPRPARDLVPARGAADLADRRGRGAGLRDGGGRQLQRRLGRPGRADLAASTSTSTRFTSPGSDAVGHRLGDRLQGASAGRSATRSSSTAIRTTATTRTATAATRCCRPSQRIWGYETPRRLVRAVLPRAVAPADAASPSTCPGRRRPATR